MIGEPQRRYGPQVGAALAFAAEVHAGQTRKGKSEPYLSHVLVVAGLVAHYGGDEEKIIAGALHDAAEDQGGSAMLAEIRTRFGDRVAHIVLDCSDALPEPGEAKPPWRVRKEAFLATLDAPDEVGSRLVEACDKLANLRDIVEDVIAHGQGTFERFNGKHDGTIWYYQELGEGLIPAVPQMQREYDRLLQQLAGAPHDCGTAAD